MVEKRVLAVLEQYVSSLIARSLLRRSVSALGVLPAELETRHLPDLARELGTGIRLFVPAEHQHALLERVRALESAASSGPTTVSVECEADISQARITARTMAAALGAGPFAAQKVITIASELARNIVLYAGAGKLEFVPKHTAPPRLEIVATDKGPGIADVERVFSGRYKSKTGMGRGLLSVRRVAETFRLDTGPGGTVVAAEFVL